MSAEGKQDDVPFDFTPIIAKMPDEARQFIDKKGWAKGEEGKPADVMGRMLTGYRELESMVGNKNLLQLPDLSNDEAFAKWPGHKIMGVPEKPDDYKFERPKLPTGLEWGKDGLEWDEAGEKMLRGAMAKGLIGQKQAGVLFNEIVTNRVAEMIAGHNARQAEATEMENSLRTAWGAGYDSNKGLAQSATKFMAEKMGMKPDEMTEVLAKTMGNAAAVRLFHTIGTMLAEDTLKGGKESGFASGPDAAKQQIKEMEADPELSMALVDTTHPGHKMAHERRNQLFKIAYPDG